MASLFNGETRFVRREVFRPRISRIYQRKCFPIYIYIRSFFFTANKNNLKIPVDMILLRVYYVYNVQLRYFVSSDASKYLP